MRRLLRGTLLAFLCLLLAFPAVSLADDDSGEMPGFLSEQARRNRVLNYAYRVLNYTWELAPEDGTILLYSLRTFPRMNGNRLVLDGTVYVAIGTVRGVPYSLSVHSDGKETTFQDYQRLTNEEKGCLAEIYEYNESSRISMLYGMSCATFLTECMRAGFPERDLPIISSAVDVLTDEQWAPMQTRGKHGMKDFPDLRPGDFIYREGHVGLVAGNDPEEKKLLIIEQSPPHDTIALCENLTDETVSFTYNDRTYEYPVRRVCMECAACRASTTGTQIKWYDYDDLRLQGYMGVFMTYEAQP